MKRTLFRAHLEGFGWEVGKKAARAAAQDLEKSVDAHVEEVADDIETARDHRAQKKAAKAQARAEAKQARAVEDELAALKKKVGRKG